MMPHGRFWAQTAWPQHSDFASCRIEAVEREQPRGSSLTDQGTSDTRCDHNGQLLLPRCRVPADDEHAASRLGEPASLLRGENLAGREPKGGGLAANDDDHGERPRTPPWPEGPERTCGGTYRPQAAAHLCAGKCVNSARPVHAGITHFRQ